MLLLRSVAFRVDLKLNLGVVVEGTGDGVTFFVCICFEKDLVRRRLVIVVDWFVVVLVDTDSSDFDTLVRLLRLFVVRDDIDSLSILLLLRVRRRPMLCDPLVVWAVGFFVAFDFCFDDVVSLPVRLSMHFESSSLSTS